MHEAQKLTWLRLFLRVLAIAYFAAFIPWIVLILLDVPILAPGGALAPWLRFQPYNPHYESMLTAIHLAWAAMLWRASHHPERHPLFLDFTIWANVAHGLVMIVATPMQKGWPMTFVESIPVLGIAAIVWWLRRGHGAPVPATATAGGVHPE